MASHACDSHTGSQLVYIGEGMDGCAADDDFHVKLAKEELSTHPDGRTSATNVFSTSAMNEHQRRSLHHVAFHFKPARKLTPNWRCLTCVVYRSTMGRACLRVGLQTSSSATRPLATRLSANWRPRGVCFQRHHRACVQVHDVTLAMCEDGVTNDHEQVAVLQCCTTCSHFLNAGVAQPASPTQCDCALGCSMRPRVVTCSGPR